MVPIIVSIQKIPSCSCNVAAVVASIKPLYYMAPLHMVHLNNINMYSSDVHLDYRFIQVHIIFLLPVILVD